MRVLMIGQTQAQGNFLGSTPYQRMRKPSQWKKMMWNFLYFGSSQRHSSEMRYHMTCVGGVGGVLSLSVCL